MEPVPVPEPEPEPEPELEQLLGDEDVSAIEPAAPTVKRTGSIYTKETKMKRYYGILREFMAHLYERTDAYPAEHEFSNEELSAIEPQDIVNWINVKMFGTLEPDFSGVQPIAGSHHTISFYRKGIGHFMPSGAEDWCPITKTGNPSRSREVRDLINKVKELNDGGILTLKKQTKKRTIQDASTNAISGEKANCDVIMEYMEQKEKRTRKAVTGLPPTKTHHASESPKRSDIPIPMREISHEVNFLLRRMHDEKHRFLHSLDEMSKAVERMKADVDTSYEVMISSLSHIGSKVLTLNPVSISNLGVPESGLIPHPRSRSLFTIWRIHDGRLTPLAADWTFPKNLSCLEAMQAWLIGETRTRTPPMQYLTAGHLKHVYTAYDGHGKVRRFMKVVKYLALKAGYWCDNWDESAIDTLWKKVWPGILTRLGKTTINADDGIMSFKTVMTALTKQGDIAKEMLNDPQTLAKMNSNDEASGGAKTIDEEEAISAASLPDPDNLDMLWGVHHGKLNPLPSDWEFPVVATILDVLHKWLRGQPEHKIPPMKYITSPYVQFVRTGPAYLSKLRCVMRVIKYHGARLGCWYEGDEDWDDERIGRLWHAVWGEIGEQAEFKRPCGKGGGKDGSVTWQSVYNNFQEGGLIKDVKADKEKDAEADHVQVEEVDPVIFGENGDAEPDTLAAV